MNCNTCPLNIDSEHFSAQLFERIPLHARALFVCKNRRARGEGADLFSVRQLCARDLWVLAFIGSNDSFASASAGETLDHLVAGGHSEILCHLFENAGYETRRDLWARMVKNYPERLYMFDALFEKECLPPADTVEMAENQHVYRHYLLYGSGPANAFIKDF
jgi:hypothetical protein